MHYTFCRRIIFANTLLIYLSLAACSLQRLEPGISQTLSWTEVPGWQEDRLSESIPALLQSCSRLADTSENWTHLCAAANALPAGNDAQARAFFEHWFAPHLVINEDGEADGLITGYFEPRIRGSRHKTEQFDTPAYARPDDLIRVELGDIHPQLAGLRLRGQLEGNTLVPYPNRAGIENQGLEQAEVLLWVDDPVDLFFLHIQGSGTVELTDGTKARLGYADQNGHPYRAIGRLLVELGKLQMDDVNMFSIRRWLNQNPERASEIMQTNPSYVFFIEREADGNGPTGSLNVPLTAERSLAIDPQNHPVGYSGMAKHHPARQQ